MTETQISCFLQVADTQSFSKAAVRLYVSQSAVSKHIAALEEEIGAELFVRDKNNIHLTVAGELIRNLLVHQKQEREAVLNDLKHIDTLAGGKIRLGCRPTWNPRNFALKMNRFLEKRFPEIELEIVGFETCGPIPMLQNGTIDAAIVYDVEPTYYNDVSFSPFTELDIGFVYAKESPIPEEKNRPEDFLDADFLTVDTPAGRILSRFYEKELRKMHFNAKLTKMISLQEALLQTALGKGVTLVDAWESCLSNSTYEYLSLNCTLPIQFVYLNNNTSPVMNVFVNEVIRYFSEKAEDLFHQE